MVKIVAAGHRVKLGPRLDEVEKTKTEVLLRPAQGRLYVEELLG